jgi:hypothetical protein
MDLTRNRARMQFDEDSVREALLLLRQGSAAAEVRVLQQSGDMLGGRFNTRGAVIAALERQPDSKGVYVLLNALGKDCPVENSLSRFHPMARDEEITRRQWLLVDVDAQRASGTNSTQREHDGALKLAVTIRESLSGLGWPEPVLADSGNGAHLLYRLPDLANTAESKALVNGVLAGLDSEFSRDGLHVDRTVGNAARISKLYGTMANKGEDTPERPRRLSAVLSTPPVIEPVSIERLRERAVVRAVEQPLVRYSAPLAAKGFTMQEFINRNGIKTRGPEPYGSDGYRWQIDCPFDKTHKAPDAVLFERGDGSKGFKCSHDSCGAENWQTLRAKLEPQRVIRAGVAPMEYVR